MRRAGGSGIHESIVNKEIADMLDGQFGWTARAERTKMVRANRQQRPDIVIDVAVLTKN